MRSAGIARRAPQPYVALCAADAARLGLSAGQAARVRITPSAGPEQTCELPLQISDLAPGVAGLPRGLPGVPVFTLPARARLEGGGR